MASRDRCNRSNTDYSGELPRDVGVRRLVSLGPERFHADMRHVDLGEGVQLSAISWGTAIEMETEPLPDRYLVTVPLAGEVMVNVGGTDVTADTGCAVIIGTEDETTQRWSADAAAIWLHLGRAAVEEEARHVARGEERAVSLPARQPVRLEPSLDLTRGDGQEWRAALQRLVDLLEERYSVASIPPHRLNVLRRDVVAGLVRAAWRP